MWKRMNNMAKAINISDKDFKGVRLNHPGLIILECASENNALLKTMEPVLQKLHESIPIPFKHLRINLQKEAFIVQQFHVTKEPSYLIFYNGDFIDRMDGIISHNDFSKRVSEHIPALDGRCIEQQK
jgi:thioredoxin-like negative regulator of GroEL